ncbi:tRNA1(Val) (adenine(37)-N6)-methyltransferase [Eubacterium oxidoreducens]|uniref:tRNA1Val (Adenine37-N6)-methyltransferase n=1 Tax=Eubacterium oxidoreducens TaxID=1732 RepID=A0A1G6A009_EUBOX|nr:tRNA1(Val) (adenine(37)-N6)-methyltransferase [Eubacterium oxidoreducens]SDB01650.1 tRNA1Val (adenine37-N6)-methyltransferase [Eubacterium oxidoreducens]
MTEFMKEGERLDDLEIKGYQIIQHPQRFCFGMDAVLLSDFAKAKPTDKIADLGTGNGIIPILLCAKDKGAQITGLEIQKESADMARRSVRYNDLEKQIQIVIGDMKDAANLLGASSFDVVTTNPPYMIAQHGLRNVQEAKTIARHEVACNLADILTQSAKLLKVKGHFYMVHRPFRLAEIMNEMVKAKLEPKRMRLVYPYIDKEPTMVLIEGIKGAKSRITVEKPLIVYEKNGEYTEEIYKIYGKQKGK